MPIIKIQLKAALYKSSISMSLVDKSPVYRHTGATVDTINTLRLNLDSVGSSFEKKREGILILYLAIVMHKISR